MPEPSQLEDELVALIHQPHQPFTAHQIRETLDLLPAADGCCDFERFGQLLGVLAVAERMGWEPQGVAPLGWPGKINRTRHKGA